MWGIHDFLAYNLFAGCVTKGHVRCPPCGPNTKVFFYKEVEEDDIYKGTNVFTT
jgi:hypothetical protein